MKNLKIVDDDITKFGVVSAPDILSKSANQNKQIFDKLVKYGVAPKFNNLIDVLNSENGASNIGARGGTVQRHIDNRTNPHQVTAQQTGAYTKEETISKINEKIFEIGSSDMTQAIYDPTGKRQDIFSSFSNPNLLINGDFQIWQRGDTITSTGDRNKYICDRFNIWVAGTKPIVFQKHINGMFIKKNGCYGGIFQKFETDYYNKYLANKEVTLTISVNNNIITNTFTLPIHQGVDGVQIIQIDNLPDEFILNWAKLEFGKISTRFIPNPYTHELNLCRRYYYSSEFLYASNNISAFFLFESVKFPVKMRCKPTVVILSQKNEENKISIWHNYSTYEKDFFVNAGTLTDEGFNTIYTSDNIKNDVYTFRVKADADIY